MSAHEDTASAINMAICLVLMLVLSALLMGCQSRPQVPDPSLFPDKSKEYNDGYGSGFRAGFQEGITYNLLAQ